MPKLNATTVCGSCGTTLAPHDASLCPACAAEMLLELGHLPPGNSLPSAELTERLGHHIPGYTLHAQIGHGGMGRVFRATRNSDSREVAVKILNAPWLASDEVCDRFRHEIEITASLDHPRTVEVIESGLDRLDRIFFYVMEFVDGLQIDDYVQTHDLPLEKTLQLFIELCRAVSDAHQVGVIHRDLKPANILVTRSGNIKILDFGLARLVDSQPPPSGGHTRGGWVGTPGYTAPEQADGNRPPDIRLDVYSLGVILTHLLKSQDPARDLTAICTKATVPDPDHRYRTADALAADLAAHLDGEPVTARPPSGWTQLRTLVKRHPRTAVFASATTVAITALAVAMSAYAYREAQLSADLAHQVDQHHEQMVELLLSCDSATLPSAQQALLPYEDSLLPRFAAQKQPFFTNPIRQARVRAMLRQPDDVSDLKAFIVRLTDLNEVRFIARRLLPYRDELATAYWQMLLGEDTRPRTYLSKAAALAVWAPDDVARWQQVAPSVAHRAFVRPDGNREIDETIRAFYPVRQHLRPYFADYFRASAPDDSYPATLYAGMTELAFQQSVETTLLSDQSFAETFPALAENPEQAMACLTSLMRLQLRWDGGEDNEAQARCAIAMIILGGPEARAWGRLRTKFAVRPTLIEKMRTLPVPVSLLVTRLRECLGHISATPSDQDESQIAEGILHVLSARPPTHLNPADHRTVADILTKLQKHPISPDLYQAASALGESWNL